MDIEIKKYKSREKCGKAAFCVDTRSIVANGKREFFSSVLNNNCCVELAGDDEARHGLLLAAGHGLRRLSEPCAH